MACLLYGVTKIESEIANFPLGVGDSAVQSSALEDVRIYWSALDNPKSTLGSPESLKNAAVQFHKVMREILARITLIPFRFPTLLDSADAIAGQVAGERSTYRDALDRIGDAVQYDIVASWSNEEADLATPVSGREYLLRRQAASARVAAVQEKLEAVTAGKVVEWRSRRDGRGHRWFALVRRTERENFIAALKTAGGTQNARLRLTGPWPPAEFVSARVPHE